LTCVLNNWDAFWRFFIRTPAARKMGHALSDARFFDIAQDQLRDDTWHLVAAKRAVKWVAWALNLYRCDRLYGPLLGLQRNITRSAL